MSLVQLANIFEAATDAVQGLNGFSFGWPSDRVRSQIYTEEGENSTNIFPRVFFAVPTLTNNPVTRRDTYQVTLFFDDLLGYDENGDVDTTLQITKWSNLIAFAEKFILELGKTKTTNSIPDQVNLVLDSFTSIQRLITVQATFNISIKSEC
jgi:hypothetical protein